MSKFTRILLLLGLFLLSTQGVAWGTDKTQKIQEPSMDWVGKSHNEGVIYVLKHLTSNDFLDSYYLQQVIQKYTNEYIQQARVPNIGRIKATEKAQVFLSRLFALIDEQPSLDIFHHELRLLRTEMEQVLSKDDADLVAGAISTAQYSGKLWTPVAKGGLSGWQYLSTDEPTDEQIRPRIDWGAVVKADVKGFLNDGLPGAIGKSVEELIRQIF